MLPFSRCKNIFERTRIIYRTKHRSSCLNDFNDAFISKLKADATVVLMIKTKNKHGMAEQRRLFMKLMNANCDTPSLLVGITKT